MHISHLPLQAKAAVQWSTMSMDDFLNTEAIDIQRAVEPRKKGMKKRLMENPVTAHSVVTLGTYPCPKTGNIITNSIDANTRKETWRDMLQEGLGEHVPDYVHVATHNCSSKEELDNLYYTFDSQDAVETAGDKFTGVCKSQNLVFETPKIKKGGINKALEYASRNTRANKKGKITNKNRTEVVCMFAQALRSLDQKGIGSNNKMFSHQAMWAAILMMLCKYGSNNDRLNIAIMKLQSGANTSGFQNPVEADPISLLISEWFKLREEGEIPNCRGLTDAKSLPLQIDFALFHLEKFMGLEDAETKIKRSAWKHQRRHPNSKYRNNYYYNTFWDNTPYKKD
jgi:hypothetical protein